MLTPSSVPPLRTNFVQELTIVDAYAPVLAWPDRKCGVRVQWTPLSMYVHSTLTECLCFHNFCLKYRESLGAFLAVYRPLLAYVVIVYLLWVHSVTSPCLATCSACIWPRIARVVTVLAAIVADECASLLCCRTIAPDARSVVTFAIRYFAYVAEIRCDFCTTSADGGVRFKICTHFDLATLSFTGVTGNASSMSPRAFLPGACREVSFVFLFVADRART